MKRCNVLKTGADGAVSGLLGVSKQSSANLLFPDGFIPSTAADPSSLVTPFVIPLFEMPVAQAVDPATLNPGPDPQQYQQFDEFTPQKFYIEHIHEFPWVYHHEPP